MPRRALPCTQADILRTTKAVLAAGLPVLSVETRKDGTIKVVTSADALPAEPRRQCEADEPNDFDEA